jgi:hypothetical protein
MKILTSLLELLCTLLTNFSVDIVVIELILCASLNRRDHFGLRLLVFLPFVAIPMVYRAVTGNSFYMLPCFYIGWFAYIFSAMIMLSALLLHFCFDEPFSCLLFYGIAAHIAQNLVYMEQAIIDILLLQEKNKLFYYLISILVIVASVALICAFLRRQIAHNLVAVENRVLLYFTVFATLIVSVLNYWVYTFAYSSLATCIYQFFCCVLLLLLQFGIFDRSKLRQEQEVMEQVYTAMEQQYRSTSANIDFINRKCHDLRRQVAHLRQSENPADLGNSLKEIENAITIYDATARTGCRVLDTLLTTMSLQCSQHSVSLTYVVDGEKLSFMADTDILSLFGNALDNAFECVQKELPDNRIITLNATEQSGFLKISLDNYCSVPVQFRDGLPVTTKENNGYHGFGTRSIQYVVQKYNGTFAMRHVKEENRFTLVVLFKIYNKELL